MLRTPNITSEGSYTYDYPEEWTSGTPDEIFVTTVYPSNDASSYSHFQLVSFDATSFTIYCQNYTTSIANVYCNILLVKSGTTSGAGPRAHVAFNGGAADMTAELASANSYNISSITDNGAGDYTINYSNPVSQPIITIGYEVRTLTPFHPQYWGILDQTDSYARIGIGSSNIYYDHPYISFVAH